MTRVYESGGTLYACETCRTVHSRWQRDEHRPGSFGAITYRCGWTPTDLAYAGPPRAVEICGAEAPLAVVMATEAVRAGRLVPLVDPEPWVRVDPD